MDGWVHNSSLSMIFHEVNVKAQFDQYLLKPASRAACRRPAGRSGCEDAAWSLFSTCSSLRPRRRSRLRFLKLLFRGALELLQAVFDAGSQRLRAELFQKPTPPAWREDEVSAVLDAAGDRIQGRAGDVRLLLQTEREKRMQP